MLLLVLIVALLPPSEAFVDCRIACRRCRENREHAVLLEVHCAMCQECKLRRKEMIHGPKLPPQSEMAEASADPIMESGIRKRTAHGAPSGPSPIREGHHEEEGTMYEEQYREGCPTPPPCQSESESEERVKLKLSTTTTTTTERTCPPVVTCRRPKRTTTTTRAPPCIPCMPMCMSPCVLNPPPPAQAPLAHNPPATCNPPAAAPPGQPTTSDYYYVYLGVPKHLL